MYVGSYRWTGGRSLLLVPIRPSALRSRGIAHICRPYIVGPTYVLHMSCIHVSGLTGEKEDGRFYCWCHPRWAGWELHTYISSQSSNVLTVKINDHAACTDPAFAFAFGSNAYIWTDSWFLRTSHIINSHRPREVINLWKATSDNDIRSDSKEDFSFAATNRGKKVEFTN